MNLQNEAIQDQQNTKQWYVSVQVERWLKPLCQIHGAADSFPSKQRMHKMIEKGEMQ